MKIFKILDNDIIKIYKDKNLSQIAGNMSFKLMLSIFPFLLIALNILSFLQLDFHELTMQIGDYVPAEIINILESLNPANGLSILALLILLYNATKGFSAMINGINSLYLESERRKSSIYGISLLLFILFVASLIFSIIFRGLGIFIIFFTVLIINILAIKPRVKIKKLLPGCFFVTFAWLILSFGFNIYINNFSNMTLLYGSIGGVMVLLIWLNLMCNTLLFGSVLNVLSERKR